MKRALQIVGIISILGLTFAIVSACGVIGKEINNTKYAMRQSEKLGKDISKKTLNADNAIETYEWFKNQEASIRELYKKELTAKETLEEFKEMLPENMTEWDRQDKTRYSILNDNLDAVTNTLNRAIEDYDAKSEMTNKNIFKDLPTNITRGYLDALQLTGGKQ